MYTFLPRDAMRKRLLCCRPLSIRLSVTFVYCIQTAEDIVKLLSQPGSPIILVFWPRAPIPNSKGIYWGVKHTGVGKFAIFDWNRRLSRKRYEIGPWLPWNVYRKSWMADRYVSVPRPWVTLKGGHEGQLFSGGSP